MAAVEEKQSISEMYHLKGKEEVVSGESQQPTEPTEEVASETSANEEETKETPTEEETVADTETTVEKEAVADTETTVEKEAVADTEPAAEEETAEEKSVPEPALKVEDIKTAPADFRFPTTNQTRHCFTRYIEYHKCVASKESKGEDTSECDKYAKYYRSLCPGEWIERWNEQRENGTFPGPL